MMRKYICMYNKNEIDQLPVCQIIEELKKKHHCSIESVLWKDQYKENL